MTSSNATSLQAPAKRRKMTVLRFRSEHLMPDVDEVLQRNSTCRHGIVQCFSDRDVPHAATEMHGKLKSLAHFWVPRGRESGQPAAANSTVKVFS
jgi:hypothetical protein